MDSGGIRVHAPSSFRILTERWVSAISRPSIAGSESSFSDKDNGITVGITILTTSDGGANWIEQTSGTGNSLGGVSVLDTNNGFTVGLGGTILQTINGGTTWKRRYAGITLTAYSLRKAMRPSKGFLTKKKSNKASRF